MTTPPTGDQLASFLFNAIHDAYDDNKERAADDEPNRDIYLMFADVAEWLIEDDRYKGLVGGVKSDLAEQPEPPLPGEH